MTNSHYFTSFSSIFFDDLFFENLVFPPLYLPKAYPPKFFQHLNKIDLPRKIFPPLEKELNLTMVKRAAQACQVGRVLDTPDLGRVLDTPGLGYELEYGLECELRLICRRRISGYSDSLLCIYQARIRCRVLVLEPKIQGIIQIQKCTPNIFIIAALFQSLLSYYFYYTNFYTMHKILRYYQQYK